MPSFLIVRSAVQDGRLDAYRQPPTLDIAGMRVTLDWGDITVQVPAGDLPVTVFVTRTSGQVEGATITLRAPAGTGTRLTFVPPLQPAGRSMLRIDGQWPSDSSMHYYAARDARALQAPPLHPPAQRAPSSLPEQRPADQRGVRVVSPAAQPPVAPTPPVGPMPGSTGSVPPDASSFGREQGARVDPVQPSTESPVQQPKSPSQQQGPHPARAPSFGQRPQRMERDLYGRQHAPDDKQPPAIPTPAEFHRLEQEAAEAQRRVYEAWQMQQHAPLPHGGPVANDGVPQPIGLAAGAGQTQPNWYPDPFRRADSRWFDGRQWTSSVTRRGARATDPPG